MTPEEVLRLAARIEDTLGPAVIVSKEEKGCVVSALRGLARFMEGSDEQEIARLRSLGRKIARPWIDGGVTAKEWCEAVDAFLK